MNCNRATQANKYHDGELAGDERVGFEAHLEQCEDCRQLLGELGRLTAMVKGMRGAEMPAGLIERLQERRRESEERTILRLAGWLTATAAGILIASLLSWPATGTDMAGQPAIWESVAIRPASELNDNGDSELLVVAQWMADDLGSAQNGELR